MKKKIIIGSVVTALIATSLFAANKNCDRTEKMSGNHGMSYHQNSKQQHGQKKHFKMQKMFKMLNLTDDQEVKVKDIIQKYKNNKTKMSDAFSKTTFDKQKFIQIASQKRDNMIKSRANMIEEVYGVLTQEQKLQLKVIMDLKMNKMMSKRFDSDKYSDGRG